MNYAMISEPVNLSTGPVHISATVRKALSAPAISHRSSGFRELLNNTAALMRQRFSVQEVFFMSGSGTLANEAMLYQVKMLGAKGLILSNGEFGTRLIRQAARIDLDFVQYECNWGQAFDMQAISAILEAGETKWLLFCHSETSTGVLNDLEAIAAVGASFNCLCFADCISSAGTVPLNLSGISMASASSGKGLASCSGLAILLSNIKPLSNNSIPLYYDLAHYAEKGHVPFTISSNLLLALYTSLVQKANASPGDLVDRYCHAFYHILQAHDLVPFAQPASRVFTIVLPKGRLASFIQHMASRQIVLSYESDYLKKRDWCQLSVFGYYEEAQLQYAAQVLEGAMHTLFKAAIVG
jgi:aspartate aminotransferase-like enzyme